MKKQEFFSVPDAFEYEQSLKEKAKRYGCTQKELEHWIKTGHKTKKGNHEEQK